MTFGGFKLGDLLNTGSNIFGNLMQGSANNRAASQAAQAQREALDFAKQQYQEQMALDKARWDATEARRAPYREASSQALVSLKRLLGLG